ncbi:hypothetical protein ASPWEDRAFT_54598 [Aspergillus wentii DTO 134E9]|uniref:Alpha-1,3-mannosyltransferase n=1 Tax=Aspergillus wentii DTO 134E9 TaxID=1073089 RepID=A0A1L9R989_ASPWE|nr:uncharacterized protein ASPWEDRAFT_54598 [Aspergillus wentii DTO 134E9]OJJ31448.1 hypothetical protein ASPWEDRAFT_54598 [Aspergillus wentii DTO 134E9]
MSALIEPIKDTGEAKIRETGLRSRSFKELFEAWEKLHLVSHHGVSYIRNDIIQYLRAHADVAKGLRTNMAGIIHSYEAYRHFLAYFSEALFPWITPYFSDPMSMRAQYLNQSRGLVFSAGNRQAPYLLTSIQSLRRIGCTLPIEVMYLGDSDLSEDFREELEVLPDVVTRDLSRMVNDDGWTLAGWAGKPFSILYSSFREVIFIDADSLFFRNPEELFEYPSYQKTGALFFKDRLMLPQSKKDWLQQILPKPISQKVRETRMWTGESAHMQESGVVVVDKWKHFVALLMVARMNGPDRDGKKDQGLVGVYDMVYGDKETFWLGWELVGDLDYTFHAGDAAVMGSAQPEPQTVQPATGDQGASVASTKGNVPSTSPPKPPKHTICAPQLLHLDSNGRPLWFNGWLLPNKFSGDKYQKPGNFTSYIREPRDSRSSGSWELKQNNVCCMTSTSVLDLSRDEVDVLGMTVDIAKRVGAIN